MKTARVFTDDRFSAKPSKTLYSRSLEYSHSEYACDFSVDYSITTSVDGKFASSTSAYGFIRDDLKMDDFLLHART